ncbi:MAG: hypothetical protein COA78_20870 [Blastopirellula sp.]|nr:MAG: hypothetical protein COA78_20870 [Blastopirellula sp.]
MTESENAPISPNSTQQSVGGVLLRAAAITAVAVFLLGFTIFWFTQPAVDPTFRVIGPSMAPALLGPHCAVLCERCQIQFEIDASASLPEIATCLNCGFQNNPVASLPVLPGSQLELVPLSETPQRFDLVAYQPADARQSLTVKRVVGLPGETIGFNQGDLYIDGERFVKTLSQFQDLAITLYNQHYEDPIDSRWITDNSSTAWQVWPGKIQYAKQDSSSNSSWLIYQHLAALPLPHQPDQLASPTDQYVYNPTLSREISPITDWIVSFSLIGKELDQLEIQFDGRPTIIAKIDFKNNALSLHQDEQTLATESLQNGLEFPLVIHAGYLDGQILLQSESGQSKIKASARVQQVRWSKTPLKFRAQAESAELKNLLIQRDLYYLNPAGRKDSWQQSQKLGQNGLFLMGDNVPVSEDSRMWNEEVNADKLLTAKVLHR